MNEKNLVRVKYGLKAVSLILLLIGVITCIFCMFDDFYFFISLIVSVSLLLLCLRCFIALEFFEISIKKGFTGSKYFWYCFIFGWIGYLMVIALPNKIAVKNSSGYELPEL